jgi:hypothetical protein
MMVRQCEGLAACGGPCLTLAPNHQTFAPDHPPSQWTVALRTVVPSNRMTVLVLSQSRDTSATTEFPGHEDEVPMCRPSAEEVRCDLTEG